MANTSSPGTTLRARTSVFVGAALLALVGVLLADAVLRGRWDVAALSLPALGLVAGLAVEVFLRPGIRLHHGGITVVNPLVTTEVPWADVADVTTRFQVSVETRDGRRIRCWGAPTAARTRPVAVARTRDRAATGTSGWLRASSPHRVIESYLAQYGDPALPASAAAAAVTVRRRWHWTTAGILAALALIATGQVLWVH
ncbi:PH domain-containing protein [Cryobacterium sp. AP23]